MNAPVRTDGDAGEGPVVLSEAARRQRRVRSIAVALTLGALVVLFYVVTIVKIGGNITASGL